MYILAGSVGPLGLKGETAGCWIKTPSDSLWLTSRGTLPTKAQQLDLKDLNQIQTQMNITILTHQIGLCAGAFCLHAHLMTGPAIQMVRAWVWMRGGPSAAADAMWGDVFFNAALNENRLTLSLSTLPSSIHSLPPPPPRFSTFSLLCPFPSVWRQRATSQLKPRDPAGEVGRDNTAHPGGCISTHGPVFVLL